MYYDERKEDRERKMREAKLEGKSDSLDKDSIDFRSKFREEISKKRDNNLNQFRAKGAAKSNKTLFIIIIIIAGIIYVQFKM